VVWAFWPDFLAEICRFWLVFCQNMVRISKFPVEKAKNWGSFDGFFSGGWNFGCYYSERVDVSKKTPVEV
jgi:hypothetical protein